MASKVLFLGPKLLLHCVLAKNEQTRYFARMRDESMHPYICNLAITLTFSRSSVVVEIVIVPGCVLDESSSIRV